MACFLRFKVLVSPLYDNLFYSNVFTLLLVPISNVFRPPKDGLKKKSFDIYQ